MVYSNRPLFMNPTGFLEGTKNKVDGGVTVVKSNGRVLSVQPNGNYEERDPGTAGEYEVAQEAGSDLIYRPGGQVFVIATRG